MGLSSSARLVVFGVCLFAGATYFLAKVLTVPPSAVPASNGQQTGKVQPVAAPVSLPHSPTARCVAAADPSTSQQVLQQMRARVVGYANRQAYGEALPELRSLAAVDPGSPGVNLDIAMSLLDLKKTREAQSSLETQIEISECLQKLPPEDLGAYCQQETFQPDLNRCRQDLQTILRSAHLGVDLVQAEIGPPTQVVAAEDVPLPTAPKPEPKRPTAPQANIAKTIARSTKQSADRTLALGVGTDAQLGAYSK